MIEWWLPDNLLHKADRMTMAHSVELRCPFLDREFVRHCMALPLDQRVQSTKRRSGRKIALKSAFASVLPAGIANQPKKGFSIPCYSWLKSVYATRARDELMNPNGLAASLFSQRVRGNLMDRAIHGDVLSQHRAWSLIILNKWADVWT
jgi:asparagine synthase (glutamine-hydrolysing)